MIKGEYATLAELDVVKPRIIDEDEQKRYGDVLDFFMWDKVTATLLYDDGSRWFTKSAVPNNDHAVYRRYNAK